MKQQNRWPRFVPVFLFGLAFAALLLIPLKNWLLPKVNHTFFFDNRTRKLEIKRLAVVGDFSDWQERYYLNDTDKDGIWQVTIPLKIGWHAYRFLINGKTWMRDWRVPDYGGAYSNSLIYVDTLRIPKFYRAIPATGTWLYKQPDTLRFVFDNTIAAWLGRQTVKIELDSVVHVFRLKDSCLSVELPPLAEGEHDWHIRLLKSNGALVAQKSGLFFVNVRNQKPQAHAGFSQFVYLDKQAVLNANRSFDPDFEPLTAFKWRQISGPQKVALWNPKKSMTKVRFSAAGRYRFELRVSDSLGQSDRDTTEVIVLPSKEPGVTFTVPAKLFKMPVHKMALVGEFNRWDASRNPMQYDSATAQWKIRVALGPGHWEYKLVLNDTLWTPDPMNAAKVPDGWNGFNSLKTVEADASFMGKFVALQNTPGRLVIAFRPHKSLHQSFHWLSDIQNPRAAFESKNNRLIFEKNAPQGTYFFYLLMKHNGQFSHPRIVGIKHYKKTEWFDFQETPAWADTAIVYELFLRRFTREGTFGSLIKKLPYFKKLGVNTLWMLPIYQSPTEHGYAPTSLFRTARDYGSLTDYRKLIWQAHRLGLKVVFDFVANHLSDQHRFVRAAFQNPASPLRQWFYWNPDGTWGFHNDWDTLVNLNYHNPWVWHTMIQAGLFWQNVGVDGFRCDVAWAVPHAFWKDFRRVIKPLQKNSLLLDEVLPRQPAFHEDEFDMSYDTDFYGNILDVLRGRKPLSAIVLGIEKSRLNYPRGAQSLRYLENHDLPRFIEQFGPQLTRLMAVVLFTIPGTPLIYYGQEYGSREIRPYFYALHNTKWFDFYQKLIKFRTRRKALRQGHLKTIALNDKKKIWWYRRQWRSDTVDVLINLSKERRIFENVPKGKILKLQGSKFKQMQNRTIKLEANSFMIIQRDEGQ